MLASQLHNAEGFEHVFIGTATVERSFSQMKLTKLDYEIACLTLTSVIQWELQWKDHAELNEVNFEEIVDFLKNTTGA